MPVHEAQVEISIKRVNIQYIRIAITLIFHNLLHNNHLIDSQSNCLPT